MYFVQVVKTFEIISKNSSRNHAIKLLASLFKEADPDEAYKIAYLALGKLGPVYIDTNFNLATKGLLKIIELFFKKDKDYIKQQYSLIGDLGELAYKLSIERQQKNYSNIELNTMFKHLLEFIKISGNKSTERKEKYLLNLFEQLDPLSLKYIIKIIVGKLRLGFSEMTLLDSFSWFYTGNKSIKSILENAYNISADIGNIIKNLKKYGLTLFSEYKIKTGTPIRPASAERLANAKQIFDKLGRCVAQPKLDGFRLQLHIQKDKNHDPLVKFFSRNLKDMSYMFPDLKKELLKMEIDNIIVEGEAIAVDLETSTFLPFQDTVKRKRKHDISKYSKEYPLKFYFFDLLYLNNNSLLNLPHKERRKKLDELILNYKIKNKMSSIDIVEEKKINSAIELEKYFYKNIGDGLEGIVVKKVNATYKAGKRNFNWVKLKREDVGSLSDTIDCVILGYYYGKGKRIHLGIGSLLVGVYNKEKDTLETIAKVGTGLSDKEWISLKEKLDSLKSKNKPHNVTCKKELNPDVWVYPEIVCLIRADEITISPLHSTHESKNAPGLALRFPRFMGFREDKSIDTITTSKEIKELYDIQFTASLDKKRC